MQKNCLTAIWLHLVILKQVYMIKQITGILLVAAYIILTPACKETDSLVNEVANQKMRDTLKQIYPSLQVSQIRIEVKDFQDVTVLLGDNELFSQPDEQLIEVTKNIAGITYYLYNENNYLDEGKVIFVANETSVPTDDDPKKEYDMNLKALLKK